MKRCENCKHFERHAPDARKGECRKRAPFVFRSNVITAEESNVAVWPVVRVDDWCGDFIDRSPPETKLGGSFR